MRFFLGVFLSCVVCASAWAEPVHGLKNPGFENGLVDWVLLPVGSPDAQAMPAAASMGTEGLRATPGKLPLTLTSTPMAVRPGKDYRVTFWGRGADDGASVTMKYANARGAAVPCLPSGGFRADTRLMYEDGFSKYTLQAIAPVGAATLEVQCSLHVSQSVDLDDFDVREAIGDGPAPVPFDSLMVELQAHPRSVKAPPQIILKVDDLTAVYAEWAEFAAIITQRGIKANIGIICNSLEGEKSSYFDWIKQRQASGVFEFWNHGYDHKEWKESDKHFCEFQNTTYEQQRGHLSKCDQLAREKLGFTFNTFGAPFNAVDENTFKALRDLPNYKIILWIEKSNTPPGIISLQRLDWANLEEPVFHPNYERFVEGYVHNRNLNYFLMQGHPGGWHEKEFADFARILDFLAAQHASFMKISDYLTLENRLKDTD